MGGLTDTCISLLAHLEKPFLPMASFQVLYHVGIYSALFIRKHCLSLMKYETRSKRHKQKSGWVNVEPILKNVSDGADYVKFKFESCKPTKK